MHLSLILLTVGLAILIRLVWARQETAWVKRWQTALATFLLPPLLLLMTSVAVLCMGTQGQMLGLQVGWLGYSLALGFVGFAGVSLLWLFWQGWRSLQQVRTYDILDLNRSDRIFARQSNSFCCPDWLLAIQTARQPRLTAKPDSRPTGCRPHSRAGAPPLS